jgi:hypothetical protein
LLPPLVFLLSVREPKAVLLNPTVFDARAEAPAAVLLLAFVSDSKAAVPIAVFSSESLMTTFGGGLANAGPARPSSVPTTTTGDLV